MPNLRALANGDTVACLRAGSARADEALEGARRSAVGALSRRTRRRATFCAGAPRSGRFRAPTTCCLVAPGLIWQPTDAQSYYIFLWQFYNPSGELGVYGGTAQTNLNAVNQNLDPEKNRNYEIGATVGLLRRLQLRAAMFRNEKTNARIPDRSPA